MIVDILLSMEDLSLLAIRMTAHIVMPTWFAAFLVRRCFMSCGVVSHKHVFSFY